MDSQILHELFTAVIKCSEALDGSIKPADDDEFVRKIKSISYRWVQSQAIPIGQSVAGSHLSWGAV